MRNALLISIYVFLQISCSNGSSKINKEPKVVHSKILQEKMNCSQEDSLKFIYQLVNVQELNPNIRVRLRYSSRSNFLKTDVYNCITHAYLQPFAAEKLANAQQLLTQTDSRLHLLIWDAVRPRSTQWKMWNLLKMPFEEKVRYVSNPKNGSVHNYGCAVDLTICNEKGEVLDMGTDFDYFGEAANINNEGRLIADGTLNYYQVDNRKMLRKVMKEAGFTTISSEWWHFNAISRDSAAKKYTIIE